MRKPGCQAFQFRLQTLLLLVAAISLTMGMYRWMVLRRTKYKDPVLVIENCCGQVWMPVSGSSEPEFMTRLFGPNYSVSPVGVSFGYRSTDLDLGIRAVASLDGLRFLDFSGRNGGRQYRISDDDLKYLANSCAIEELLIEDSTISDAGLVHLARLHSLRRLQLRGSRVKGQGLSHLRRLDKLERLDLSESEFDDSGIVWLQQHPALRAVFLGGTRVTNQGVARLRTLRHLQRLYLEHTCVGDAGLAYLSDIPSLEALDLRGTHATSQGISRLKAAIPRCEIIEPNGKPDGNVFLRPLQP